MKKIASLITCFAILFIISLPSSQPKSFSTTSQFIPNGVPLPGAFIITAGYHDPSYVKIFHKEHTGIDLIPAPPYKNPVILHSTISGIAYHYSEQCSGNAIIIINPQFIVYLGHIASFLVPNQSHVSYGENVATMGESGELGVCITGAHVHYQIYKKVDGKYMIVDPTGYIN